MKNIVLFLSAALLSMPLFSTTACAEISSESATASTHALVTIAPKGRWVIQMETRYDSFDSMYDNTGNERPLGDSYNAVSLGPAVFPLLALFPAGASLGMTSLTSEASVLLNQITIGYGVTENLTVGVISNFGRSQNSVSFSVAGGNVGWNPLYNPGAPAGVANFPFALVGGGATQAMTAADINNILSSPAFGYEYKPIKSSSVSGMGTVLVGALWRFYEGEYDSLIAGFGVRKSLDGEKDPDSLTEIPLDGGSSDVIAQVEYYRQIASIFDLRLMVKRTFQLSDKVTSRVAAPGQLLALASSKEILHRNLGDFWEYDVQVGVSFGHWRVSSAWYRYLKKSDHYYSTRGQDVSSLIQNSANRADQWRVGISWSGIDAWRQKKIPIPLIVKLEMLDTFRGRNVSGWRDYYLVMTTFF